MLLLQLQSVITSRLALTFIESITITELYENATETVHIKGKCAALWGNAGRRGWVVGGIRIQSDDHKKEIFWKQLGLLHYFHMGPLGHV